MSATLFNLEDFLEKLCSSKYSLSPLQKEKLEKALARAYDMLKFEMELYWKRATYFWGITAVAFTAYFIVSDPAKYTDRPEFPIVVNSIGLIFSFALYLVNRGSKFWQNNWHFFILAIENLLGISISQFKRIQQRHIFSPLGAYPFAFSSVHHITSLYITLIWVILYVRSVYKSVVIWHVTFLLRPEGLVVVLTLLAMGAMCYWGKSKFKDTKVAFTFGEVIQDMSNTNSNSTHD